jgi:thioesterase domain-containing protein
MMSSADLQQYLHEHIPLSKAMSVKVVSVDLDTVMLSAPLQPNINHRETVFGHTGRLVLGPLETHF